MKHIYIKLKSILPRTVPTYPKVSVLSALSLDCLKLTILLWEKYLLSVRGLNIVHRVPRYPFSHGEHSITHPLRTPIPGMLVPCMYCILLVSYTSAVWNICSKSYITVQGMLVCFMYYSPLVCYTSAVLNMCSKSYFLYAYMTITIITFCCVNSN